MSKYKLINNFVLVEKMSSESQVGSVQLGDTDKEERNDGIIVSKSADTKIVKQNDRIVYYKHSGIETRIDGKDYIILDENEILCIIRGDKFLMTCDRVLLLENHNVSQVGKIVLAERDTSKRTSGKIISVSKQVKNISVDDNVMFSKYSGVYVTIDKINYKVLDKKEIFIII